VAETADKRPTLTLNRFATERLREAATLLSHQQDNPYRVAAYRRAADAVAALDRDLRDIMDGGGVEALEQIPGVGAGIAAALAEMIRTGRWGYLDRLRGSGEPGDVFCTIPGIGPELAKRLHETLHVETLAPALPRDCPGDVVFKAPQYFKIGCGYDVLYRDREGWTLGSRHGLRGMSLVMLVLTGALYSQNQTLVRCYFLNTLLTAIKSKATLFPSSITVTELSRTSRTMTSLCGCICLRYSPASRAISFRSRYERVLPSTLISKQAPICF
jgi:hypothetical protein